MIKAGPVDILGANDKVLKNSSVSDCMKGCDADQLCQVGAIEMVQYGSALTNLFKNYLRKITLHRNLFKTL